MYSPTHSFIYGSQHTRMPMKSHSWVKVLHVRSCESQAVLGKAVEGAECCLLLALLFSKELEDRWEVLGGVAACAHHAVNLMGQRAQRHWGLCVSCCILSKSQILRINESKCPREIHNCTFEELTIRSVLAFKKKGLSATEYRVSRQF